MPKQRVLILCTGNSARSQMAEGLLREIAGHRFDVFSAGTLPVGLNTNAVKAMAEIGINISGHRSKSVDEFAGQTFDYVITVCDNARESCPIFPGAAQWIHHSFEDPAASTTDQQPAAFRRVRDQLAHWLREFTKSALPSSEFERFRSAITRYIDYLIRDAADAEDLTQETLIRAHRQRDTLRDPAALESWLYQIATHVSIDRMRQRAKAAERHVDKPVEELPIADEAHPSPLTVIQQEEMSACVQRYVGKLPDAYKAVLLLHDSDGLTANEISDLLQLPLTTVKMRLHRARRQLQAALNGACNFGRDERGVFICEPKPEDD